MRLFTPRVDAGEVVPGLLIGSAPRQRQRAGLARDGVTVVVDLRAEAGNDDGWPASIEVIRRPMVDGRAPDIAVLDSVTAEVMERLTTGHRVFIHCHAGVGRSATVVCATLMRMGWSLGDAFRALRACRPQVAPTDAQLQLLADLERRVRPGPAPPGSGSRLA